ncbi:V-type ATPase 116 kDa subunit [Dethiosulfovibrio peptidovorans DSM 11002]|uniref:V-type ATPase 116 kDa subunit n=1 Tax=Dethiosulfovibrio peptidovorans DSM 11002 TaxID=469381 RepID=D2Z3Y5_9BACT|nr:V-type ATPase 116kDa subunit family protein [Dethiosulfovibrio peptidovorans]EFC92246.1 V-type ATPase 116 kDa subunit [Dethiosulfovibrio peptidovorans DSM 11002]
MIRKMIRVAIWGLTSRQREIVSFLHDQGVLHVEHGEAVRITDEEADSLRLLRSKLLGMVESLEWDSWEEIRDEDLNDLGQNLTLPFSQMIEETNESLDHFKKELSSLLEQREEARRLRNKLKGASHISVHFRSFVQSENEANRDVSIWWLRKEQIPKILSEIQSLLVSDHSGRGPVPELHHHVFHIREKESLLAVGVPLEYRGPVNLFLESEGLVSWTPPGCEPGMGLLRCIEYVDEKLNESPKACDYIEETLSSVRAQWGIRLGALFILIDERLEQLVVEQRGKDMGEAFMLEGWLPEDERDLLCEKLKKVFGDDVMVRWRYPTSDEWQVVPTAISNPTLFKPFEIFLKLVSPPSYRGTDPTVMIGIFFPFFAGCIIGDAGYGIILASLAWWIRKRTSNPMVADGAFVLLTMAFWSVIWGVIYGEYFGDVAHRIFGIEPLVVERSHAVVPVLAFSVALGLAHILLGLALGVIEGIKNRSHHVWMERGGNMVIILSMIGALCATKGVIPQSFFSVSMIVLAIGLILLIAGGGVGGLVESMSSFGSILSYVRIGAIGLSSAILAMVASKFVDVLGVSFLGIFIALAIHLLNFVLATAESGLHSARLHYVEFMGTFYSGGDTEYRPFAKKRRRSFNWKKR